jgi:hypothetical protein
LKVNDQAILPDYIIKDGDFIHHTMHRYLTSNVPTFCPEWNFMYLSIKLAKLSDLYKKDFRAIFTPSPQIKKMWTPSADIFVSRTIQG